MKENRAPGVNDPQEIKSVPPYLADTPETREDLARYYNEISRMDRQIGKFIAELEKRDLKENTLLVFLSDNGNLTPAQARIFDFRILEIFRQA